MKKPTRLFDIPRYQADQFPKEDALAARKAGEWVKHSTHEFIEKANAVSRGLLALGIQKGDKVAMISENRPEWNIMDIGIMQIGAVDVPIYPSISTDDYHYIFDHAEVRLCIVSTRELYDKVAEVKDKAATLEKVYSFDELEGVAHWTEIPEAGDEGYADKVQELMDGIDPHDLATFIYTSGTTGRPKGVMLSHDNIASNARASRERLPVGENSRALTFLPVCHVYERMIHYLYMLTGVSIYFADSIDTVGEDLRATQPDVFSAVPRLLEKVYDRIVAKGYEQKGVKKKLFFWALALGHKYDPREKMGLGTKLKYAVADKLIFSKWREAVGGQVKAVASGSAPLQPRLARVFNAAGIPVLEGYGLTETSPVVSVNSKENNGLMIGTVGRPIRNVKVKIAEDGEVLVQGPNVMLGYYKDEEKTKAVLDENGWFYTGDIGEMVNGEFLKITDRKKEMFKTAGGKYIAPGWMENKFKESPFIEQIMVIGEGRKFPAALIVPAFEHIREWGRYNEMGEFGDEKAIANDPTVRQKIEAEVEGYNQSFGQWERIKKFELIPGEWSVETDELTPTLKVKRKVVMEKYQHLIDKIYAE